MSNNVHFGPDQPNCPAHFCPFCPKKGQRDFFLKNLFWPLFTPYCPLTSCKKSEKTNDSIFFKVSKTLFRAHFGPFWPKKGPRDFFFENRAPSLFSLYGPLTSCKKSEKTNDTILRKTPDRRTDWRTDWQTRVIS